MKNNKHFVSIPYSFLCKWVLPLFLIVVLQVSVYYPSVVEKYYSIGVYPKIASVLRSITGLFSFSIGDVLIGLLLLFLVFKIIRVVYLVILGKIYWGCAGKAVFKYIRLLMWLYIAFNFLWGLNYNRMGIGGQLNMQPVHYSTDELCDLTDSLIGKMNECRLQLGKDTILPEPAIESIYSNAVKSYGDVSSIYPVLQYKIPAIKSNMYGWLGAYLGYSGYYNPYTGEAQIRSDLPRVLLPYITCHEMAHQLGYAGENEANFVGYLAASSSKDVYTRYSVYLDLYFYTRSELYRRNTFPGGDVKMDSLVKKDIIAIRRFFLKEQMKTSQTAIDIYDAYLKANHQNGIESYDEVIGWLIAYHKTHPL